MLTDRIDKQVLSHTADLRVTANVAVGHENIDLEGAHKCGIAVTNTPGLLTEATVDFTLALLLSLARRVASAG